MAGGIGVRNSLQSAEVQVKVGFKESGTAGDAVHDTEEAENAGF